MSDLRNMYPNSAHADTSTEATPNMGSFAHPKAPAPAPALKPGHDANGRMAHLTGTPEQKPGHDADGRLQEHLVPAKDLPAGHDDKGKLTSAGDAMYPSMAAAHSVTAPAGYEHLGLVVEPAAQGEFLGLCKEFGLSQAQAQRLTDLHVKLVYGPKGGSR